MTRELCCFSLEVCNLQKINGTQKCTVLCSAYCIHNSHEGYYNICKNPKAVKLACYGGIDRIYLSRCELQQSDRNVQVSESE